MMRQHKIILLGALLFMMAPAHTSLAQGGGSGNDLHPAPNPAFGVTGLCLGDSTHFINLSIGAWDFNWYFLDSNGDTLFSTVEAEPAYYFDSAGTYTVTLYGDNGHITSASRDLTIGTDLYAGFMMQKCAPGGTRFASLSGCADQYLWIFPDGTTSDSNVVDHRFDTIGSFPVTLIAINGNQRDTLTDTVDIDALGIPTGNFTYTQQKDIVYFTPLDVDGTWFSWDFGDGTFLDTTRPVTIKHYFDPDDDQDIYNVLLYVTNNCGVIYKQQTIDTRKTTGMDAAHGGIFPLRIFPNPSFGNLTIEGIPITQEQRLRIYTMDGKLCLEKIIPPNTGRVSLYPELLHGLYVVEWSGPEGTAYQKWMLR